MPLRRPPIERVALGLVLVTLALLPFEYALPWFPLGPFTLTSLEAVWLAGVGCWLLSLGLGRRRPNIPLGIFGALGLLLVAGFLSAALADGHKSDAFVFLARSLVGWLLFLTVADLIRDRRDTRRALAAVVAGATVSALIGVVLIVFPGVAEQIGMPQYFAAGAPRLTGSFDYPNTAAMFFEAAAFLGAALIALESHRRRMIVEIAAVAVIVAAMMLTLSRGSIVGMAAGLGVVALLAVISGWRRAAGALAGGAVAVVVVGLLVQVAVAPVQRLLTDAEIGLYGATYMAPAAMNLGSGTVDVPVEVTNTGTLIWNGPTGAAYRLGYHWLRAGTNQILSDGEHTVPLALVEPGQSERVTVSVTVPDPTQSYEIAWDIARSNVAWLSERGIPVVTTRLQPGPAATSAPPMGSEAVTLDNADIGPTRAELWSVAAQMIQERPLLGVGPGTYRLRYASYAGPTQATVATHSNETYLELASTTGIVGLVLFLIVVGLSVARLVRALAARRDPASAIAPRTWLALGAILAAVMAYLVHGLFDYMLSFNATAGLWWATLGLALVAVPALTSGDNA